MEGKPDELPLEYELCGSKVKVTARLKGELVFMDTIDPTKNIVRQRFIKALVKIVPMLDPKVIDAELLRIAETMKAPPQPAAGNNHGEIDSTRIVRPDMFITREVCGLAVPIPTMLGGKLVGRWMVLLRWADGRRECRELTAIIELPGGEKLIVHPLPGEPSMTATPGWASKARRAWLDGAAAPNPAEVFKRICETIAHFIDLPQDVAPGTTATLAVWSMLTYFFRAWDAIPYLFVGGPLSSGKTRIFEILNRLVYRPMQSSNLTGPALFRTLHDRGGTLLYDEAERLKQTTPDVQEVLSMLLAGYKRGGQATRLEAVGDTFRPVAFDVFGPKALACIAGLPPPLASRCISLMMFRAGPLSPKPQRRIDADPTSWQRTRDDLHILALEYGPTMLELVQRADVCPTGIYGRAFELWQPLLALAFWIQSHGAAGLLSLMQKHALDSIDATRDDQIPEVDETLLEILTEAVKGGEWLTPGDILSRAQERDSNSFGNASGKGPKWQANTVTRRLKNYGIPVPKKSNGLRRYRVDLGTLGRIQRHYGIDLGILDPAPNLETPTLTDPVVPNPLLVSDNGRVGQGQ